MKEAGTYLGSPLEGEEHPGAVLTEELVREMRRLQREEGLGWCRVCKRMGLEGHEVAVKKVLRGITWKHVR